MNKVFSRRDSSRQTEQFGYKADIAEILARNMGVDFARYRERLERAVSFAEELDYPIHIDFETIFGCNLRCVMCTHAHRDRFRPRKTLMDIGLFKKVVDEGAVRGLASIGLDQEGEPLLVKNLLGYISYARRKGILDIMINTNALELGRDTADALINSGLTRIHFSLDAATKGVYDKIRIGSDFDKVVKNILYFCERKRALKKELPVTRVSFVLMRDNEREKEEFVKFWAGRVDAIAIQEYNSPFPQIPDLGRLYAKTRVRAPDFRCTQPWFRMVVLTDGTVLPCCLLGMSLKMAVGNAYDKSIYELWNSETVKRLRAIHKEARYGENAVCALCAKNFV